MKMNKYVKATGIALLGVATAGFLGKEAYESFHLGNTYQMLGENFDSIVTYTKSGVTALGALTSLGLTGKEAIKFLKNKSTLENLTLNQESDERR